jgi:hypothetical protein
MKKLTYLEMKTINGGQVPQAYYMDNDVIKTTGRFLKQGFSFLRNAFYLAMSLD